MSEELTTEGAAQANPDAVADGVKAGDVKPEGEAKGAEGAKDAVTKPVVPEAYDLKVEKDTLFRPDDLDRIKAEAKERGLTNEQAQEYLETQGKAVSTYHAGLLKGFETERDGWIKTAEADKEIGGKAFKGNVEMSRRLLKEVASEDFYNKVLAPKSDGGLGYGDHPEMIRIFTRLANRGFANDETVNGGASKKEEVSLEKRLYPDLK